MAKPGLKYCNEKIWKQQNVSEFVVSTNRNASLGSKIGVP